MSGFRRADRQRVNVFEVDGAYCFRHYFEGEDVFERLRPYYERRRYRFVVPPDEFEDLRAFLAEHGYGLVVVEAPAPFAVLVRKYTAHPDIVFEAAVARTSVDGYNCFLLADEEAVAAAVDDGATRLADTDLEYPF